MKNLIVAAIAVTVIGFMVVKSVEPVSDQRTEARSNVMRIAEDIRVKPKTKVIPYDNLIRAIIHVESKGDDSAVNESGAVGCMQIKPIMVREVNRILIKIGETRQFKLEDRLSRFRSVQMFTLWRQYHHESDSDEVIARCWNGGGNGYKMKSTERYWNKVQRILKSFSETR
jgi:hypothetical protein